MPQRREVRDEERVLDAAEFTLPGGEARYRLVATVERGGSPGLSSEVGAAWTFTSGRTSEETGIPASVVRFAPEPALDGTSEAGPRPSCR